ncbi:MAG: hypothetical protein ACKOQ4_01925 [Mycobacterium sp.]
MSSSNYIGRVGGLALALGVGAAVLTNCATATADTSAPGTSGPSASDTGPAKPARGAAARAARIAAAAAPAPDTDSTRPSGSDSASAAAATDPGPATARRGKLTAAAKRAAAKARKSAAAVPAPQAPSAATVDLPSAPSADAALTSVPAPAAATESESATPAGSTATPEPPATGADREITLAGVVLPTPTPAEPSVMVQAPGITPGPAAGLAENLNAAAQLALAMSTAAAGATAPSANSSAKAAAKPALVLDGYNVVPTDTETVYTFYGRWTSLPGLPNSLQGAQKYQLVDPKTQEKLGRFDALVSQGDPTSVGTRYVSMLVTDNDGVNVGTGAGQTPPVGSLISTWTVGPFALSYAAMPSPTGDKVTFKLQTPFGSIRLPMPFDASKGIADHTFDNRPVDLGNGFSIAPSDPDAEVLTGSAGVLPLFSAVQGVQKFDLVDSDGNSVGSFDGEFTTTADVIGLYTQAILVTANDGINVGTDAGQIPPVGTVYNVIYFGSDDFNLIYSSSPVSYGSGDVTTTKLLTPSGNVTIPVMLLNTSKEPAIKLSGVGGKTYVATSDFIPAGINGLPPRDVQYQGYQQFEVKDFTGTVIGTIDADVTSQWSFVGVNSKALLVTNVTSGKVGLGPGDIPPVGTTMTFTYFPNGLGYADAVIPQAGFDINAFTIQTIFGEIPLFPAFVPNPDRAEVDYFNPFLVV